MSNPPATPDKAASGGIADRVKGIVQDFWADPECTFPALVTLKLMGKTISVPNLLKPQVVEAGSSFAGNVAETTIQNASPATAATPLPSAAAAEVPTPAPPQRQRWHALPGEIAEKMWGEGQVLPAGDIVMDMLLAPLNLAKEKVVLDLSAGLGASLRRLSMRIYSVKGLEIDPAIAARGMEMSTAAGKAKQVPIEAYDPLQFSMPAIYDCMIAREMFYKIADKGRMFYSIGAGIKFGGQAAFTDFIVEAENREQPAIKAWQSFENNVKPLGLIEMAEQWAKVGFDLKGSEDQTPFYRREIVTGINRLVGVLNDLQPDADTKRALLREVETWVHRLSAIQQGMKYYRFHAVKS